MGCCSPYADEQKRKQSQRSHNSKNSLIQRLSGKREQSVELSQGSSNSTIMIDEDSGQCYTAIELDCDTISRPIRNLWYDPPPLPLEGHFQPYEIRISNKSQLCLKFVPGSGKFYSSRIVGGNYQLIPANSMGNIATSNWDHAWQGVCGEVRYDMIDTTRNIEFPQIKIGYSNLQTGKWNLRASFDEESDVCHSKDDESLHLETKTFVDIDGIKIMILELSTAPGNPGSIRLVQFNFN